MAIQTGGRFTNQSYWPSGRVLTNAIAIELGLIPLEAIPAAIAIDVSIVPKDGGYEVVVTGGIDDGTYIVYVGPLGSESDPACTSGIEGQNPIITFSSGEGLIITPPLPVGGPYALTFRRLTGTGDPLFVSDPLLTVVPKVFRSATMRLRRYLSLRNKTGPRSLMQEEYPQ